MFRYRRVCFYIDANSFLLLADILIYLNLLEKKLNAVSDIRARVSIT